MLYIRESENRDLEEIKTVHLRAFPSSENKVITKLALELLREIATPPILSLVAETENDILGHVIFSPVKVEKNGKLKAYILAPLGVKPDHHGQRIGTKLVEDGLQQLKLLDVDIVFVYGDPNYYGRFGFEAESAAPFKPPCKLQYPFGWQAVAVNKQHSIIDSSPIMCLAPLNDQSLW